MSSSRCVSARSSEARSGNGRTASLPVNIATAGRKTLASKPREQPRDLPAAWCDKVAMGFGWPEDQALQSQTTQIVGLSTGVIRDGNAQKVGDQPAQVAIMEAVDQVLKQGQCQKQRHNAGLAELQCQRLLTVCGDGRLHYAVELGEGDAYDGIRGTVSL